MIRPLLDTHIWVWWMLGVKRLDTREGDALDAFPREGRPALSDISLWELATLVDLGRIRLDMPLDAWLRIAAASATVARQRISEEIVAEMNRLPASFHRDPADGLSVATSRALALPVATRDRRIIDSGLVTVWVP